jgi:hypothetical protein
MPEFHGLDQRGELRGRQLGVRHRRGKYRNMPLMRPPQQEPHVILEGKAIERFRCRRVSDCQACLRRNLLARK